MDDLTNLYDEINRRGTMAVQRHEEQVDSYLQNMVADHRRGLTLLAHLPAHVTRNINFCLQELRTTMKGIYFYPVADMHITLLDLLAARDDFYLDRATTMKYEQALQTILANCSPIDWRLDGFIVSPGAIMVKGFYSPNLVNLRAAIRKHLPEAGLEINERYPTFSGHVTVARFKTSLADPWRVLDFVAANHQVALGRFQTTTADLVIHDWYNHHMNLLASLHLG